MLSIQQNIGIPKYRQLIESVETAIANGGLKKGEKLPSVNKIRMMFSLSRDTVLLAYEELKKRGIVYAIPGKGYYVKSLQTQTRMKIFLLFDELNIFKEDIYRAFLEEIGSGAQVDIFFHHFNIGVFAKLIGDASGNYTHYIIMPTNLSGAETLIKSLPARDVFILDQINESLGSYPAVYQNFVSDVYNCLTLGRDLLAKYTRMIMLFPGFREPVGMRDGFVKFCVDNNIAFEVAENFAQRTIARGDVFLIPDDRDLVTVIEKGKAQDFLLGADYGIISYNDTPLKKVVENGITTISTDFSQMGKVLATLIIKNKREQIENACSLIVRNSL